MNKQDIESLVKIIQQKAKDNVNYEKELTKLIVEFEKHINAIILENFNSISDIIDDLKQEGRLSIEKAVLGYNFDKNIQFSTFASHCAENAMRDYLRSQNAAKNKIVSDSVSLGELPESLHPTIFKTPEDLVIEKEALAEISEKLDDFEKQVFDLFSQGYKYKEIANILNKKEKDIDNCIQRIRKKI